MSATVKNTKHRQKRPRPPALTLIESRLPAYPTVELANDSSTGRTRHNQSMQLAYSESASNYTRESELTEKSIPRHATNYRVADTESVGSRIKAFLCSFHGLLTVCGVILAIKYLPSFLHWVHPRYWDAPKTWNTCQNAIGQHWSYMGSPCVKHDDSLCTYSTTALFSWCNGRYYTVEEDNGGKWSEFAAYGDLPAIWTAGNDCDELGFEGWENVCQNQNVENDGGNSNVAECRMNQIRGFMYCGDGISYTYSPRDGSYSARDRSSKVR